MIRVVDLRARMVDTASVVPRAAASSESGLDRVSGIVADVAVRGEEAILEWTERLDGFRPPVLRVPAEALAEADTRLDPLVRAALGEAIGRVRLVHEGQVPMRHDTDVAPGGRVSQRWIPVERVGLYVPGGNVAYPSSVIMNVVPAQVAGVESLAVASPPQRENGGLPDAVVLAACAMLGVDEVYAVGGAQAIAMLAHGVSFSDGTACRPVDMITGPGNVYVTAAKRLVKGLVGIDSEAGPTEVMVIADDSADAACVASDLMSQAEHDTMAACVLVTDSPDLVDDVVKELARQVAGTKHRERITAALGGPQSAIMLVADLAAAFDIANAYGAEHLEVQTRNSREDALRVRNAGAIFVGQFSPVSLGDYAAGSNHVLPTGGTAAHSSGLGVHTFLRAVQVIDYDKDGLAGIADVVRTLAESEDLPAHGAAISSRSGDSQ
ncbi:MAG: histidinol dehydrogenase [Candidatus Nanopelagicales bacterium]|nr:histidinol dehydrogenase [Candidatus Nanopelagicales bacterium]